MPGWPNCGGSEYFILLKKFLPLYPICSFPMPDNDSTVSVLVPLIAFFDGNASFKVFYEMTSMITRMKMYVWMAFRQIKCYLISYSWPITLWKLIVFLNILKASNLDISKRQKKIKYFTHPMPQQFWMNSRFTSLPYRDGIPMWFFYFSIYFFFQLPFGIVLLKFCFATKLFCNDSL